jgi:regulator of protease activity HflC (stomatin/prohibitin superfamily)
MVMRHTNPFPAARGSHLAAAMAGWMHSAGGAPVRPGRLLAVDQWERALLFRAGALVATLGPGGHRRWRSKYTIRRVDLRPWVLTVPTQEVPTADGVNVKVTVAGRAQVVDAVAFVTAVQDPHAALYLAVQVALREIVAGHSVEELLTGRAELGAELTGAVRGLDELGLAVDSLELKDVGLPADLKRARAEVLVARAQGLAALERARGETAALRSLANAARQAEGSPALLQLRLLQVAATPGHTVVIGAPALTTVAPPAGARSAS